MNKLFARLTRRQQVSAIGALLLLIIALLVIGVVLPLHRNLDDAKKALAQARADHADVSTLVAELQNLQRASANAPAAGDLTAVLTATLQTHGLRPSRLQQGNTGELQLRLEGVEFNTVAAWLASLEKTSSVRLVNISVVQGTSNTANVNVGFRAL